MRGYPTYIMVDHDGEVTDRFIGYPGVEGFIAIVDAALADRRTIAAKQEAFAAEPTVALARSLGRYSEATFANQDAVAYYRQAMAMDPAGTSELPGKVFLSMYYGLRGGDFTADDVVGQGREILMNDDVPFDQAVMVAQVVGRVADEQDYRPLLERALAATAGATGEEQIAARRTLEIDGALLLDNDAEKAVFLKRDSMPEGWRDDSGQLNAFAWWCAEHEVNLDEAYELAMRAADLASSDRDRANVLDTAATVAFTQGKIDHAIELQEKAVALAPESDALKSTLARFQAALGG